MLSLSASTRMKDWFLKITPPPLSLSLILFDGQHYMIPWTKRVFGDWKCSYVASEDLRSYHAFFVLLVDGGHPIGSTDFVKLWNFFVQELKTQVFLQVVTCLTLRSSLNSFFLLLFFLEVYHSFSCSWLLESNPNACFLQSHKSSSLLGIYVLLSVSRYGILHFTISYINSEIDIMLHA